MCKVNISFVVLRRDTQIYNYRFNLQGIVFAAKQLPRGLHNIPSPERVSRLDGNNLERLHSRHSQDDDIYNYLTSISSKVKMPFS